MTQSFFPVALAQPDLLVPAVTGATLAGLIVATFAFLGRLKALEKAIAKSSEERATRKSTLPLRTEDDSQHVLRALEAQTRWLQQIDSSLDAVYRQLSKSMTRSMKQLGSIADELDSRRAEVESFRKGQEGMVAKKMLGEVVRIRCEFAAEAEDPRTSESQRDLYGALLQLVDDHLQSSGVEQRSPRLGSDFRGNELCEDRPKTVSCEDPELDWTVASVQESAWVYEEGSKLTVLGKARVTIHRYRADRAAEAHG
jgi:hypothetical protein